MTGMKPHLVQCAAMTGPVFCRKCGTLLTPGRGDFYVVEIEAYAENSPPVITEEDLAKDHRAEMERLAEEMAEMSAQEAMDTVHRKLAFFLCRECYKGWIEEPVG
jgi:RNase P subunit RPR2